MQTESKNTISNVLRNTAWIIKLSFRFVPFPTFARLVGDIYDYVSNLIRSFILGVIVDWVIAYSTEGAVNENYILYSLILFAGFYVLSAAVSVVNSWGKNMLWFHNSIVIPQTLLNNKISNLSIRSLENPDIQNKITRYSENRYVFDNIIRKVFLLIGIIIGLISSIIPLLFLIPEITMLLIVISIPIVILNKIIIDTLWNLDKDTTEVRRRGWWAIGVISDPASVKEVKLLNAFEYLRGYFEEYVNKMFYGRRRIYIKWTIFDIISAVFTGAVVLFGIYQLILLIGQGVISTGQIIFYITALLTVGRYLDTFAANFADFLGNNIRLNEMRGLLNYEEKEPESVKQEPTAFKTKTAPTLSLRNVSFAYPGSSKNVIEGLNLEIKSGEKIAIVGENGAGKTTLVKLIAGIYDVIKGRVMVNNQDLNSLNKQDWFKHLGVLYQDYNTYDDLTAFENIALGRIENEIDYDKVRDAAKKADAHDFIMDYENNYSQVLSERYDGGIRPSTGQWQKIAIARFFYRNAPILILDEPTASIDAVSEANIFDRIYKFIKSKTVIIISHRFSTVRNADRIIVFDKGKIVEEGSHTELLQKNGMYAKAFKSQAKGYEG